MGGVLEDFVVANKKRKKIQVKVCKIANTEALCLRKSMCASRSTYINVKYIGTVYI